LMHGPMDEVYQRIKGNMVVIAQIERNLDLALSLIRSNPAVRDIQVEGSRITIEFSTPEHDNASLLKTLIENGVSVSHFGTKEPNLEEVFMMVTKGLVA